MRHAAFVVVLVAAGCESGKWIETRATQIHVAGLEANIPSGWRDFNELRKKPDIKLVPGSRTLLLDSNTVAAEIAVIPLPTAIDPDHCEDVASSYRPHFPEGSSLTNVKKALFKATNPGCLMNLRVPSMDGLLAIMTAGNGRTVIIRCLTTSEHDLVENACYEVIYGLHPVP